VWHLYCGRADFRAGSGLSSVGFMVRTKKKKNDLRQREPTSPHCNNHCDDTLQSGSMSLSKSNRGAHRALLSCDARRRGCVHDVKTESSDAASIGAVDRRKKTQSEPDPRSVAIHGSFGG